MADAVLNKIPAITFTGISRDGEWPYWHQRADTFDKVDPLVMEKSWSLVRAMIDQQDKE